MEIRLGGVNLRIKFSFFLMLGIFLIRDVSNLLSPVLAAIVVHELGHLLCMISMGLRLQEVTLSVTGIHIQKSSVFLLPPPMEIMVHSAGPLANFTTAIFLLFLFPCMERDYFLVLNIMFACVNIMPFGNLDGANILRTVLSEIFAPREAGIIFKILSVISALGLLCAMWFYRDTINLSAVLLWIYLLYMTLKS